MNKRLALGIGGIIVIAIIAGFIMRKKPTNTEVKNTTSSASTTQQAEQPKIEQASLKSLLGMSGTKKCTFMSTDNATVQGNTYLGVVGTVYVDNGKMRGEFSGFLNNARVSSYMITDSTTSYVWVDGQTTGYKMSLEKLTAADSAAKQRGIDPNKNFDFSCSNWSGDGSLFTTPTNVQFTDLSAMLEKAPTGGLPTKELTGACNSLQEPAKSQCESALKGK